MFPQDSAHDAYWHFVESVKKSQRYVRPADVECILQEIVECAQTRDHQTVLPAGTVLWRTQLGHVLRSYQEGGVELDVLPYAFPRVRMVPDPRYVGDGRANPSGIAYLYAATDEDTAVAEVRPWRGGFVSLAKVTTIRELTLANLTADRRVLCNANGDGSAGQRRQNLWGLVNEHFAKPVDPHSQGLEYIPTQIVAEAIRVAVFDGIKYMSSLGPGQNVLLFDPKDVTVEDPVLCRIEKVAYEFIKLPHRGYSDGADIGDGGPFSTDT